MNEIERLLELIDYKDKLFISATDLKIETAADYRDGWQDATGRLMKSVLCVN